MAIPVPVLILTTVASKAEAQSIAKHLLDRKLIACANIVQTSSLFSWKGKIDSAEESLVLLKSVSKNFAEIESVIVELSSYECPSIEMLAIEKMNDSALKWLMESAKDGLI